MANQKKTRKLKSSRGKALTIPELKSAFETLEVETHKLLRAGHSEKELTKKFQELWKSIFHRPVTATAVEAYLKLKRHSAPPSALYTKGKTRKLKGGGGPLAGAPLDYMTRPGVDGSYGSFPAYVSGGLKFYDTVNQEGMFQECGTKDFTPKISASMGSDEFQKGGAKKKQTAGGLSNSMHLATFKPFNSESPPSMLQTAQDYMAGKDIGPSSAPEVLKLRV